MLGKRVARVRGFSKFLLLLYRDSTLYFENVGFSPPVQKAAAAHSDCGGRGHRLRPLGYRILGNKRCNFVSIKELTFCKSKHAIVRA